MDIKAVAAKRAAAMFGLDLDGSLPELIESVNESFDLGLTIETPKGLDAVKAAVVSIAETASDNLSKGESKFFVISAAPVGKPPVHAFVVVG